MKKQPTLHRLIAFNFPVAGYATVMEPWDQRYLLESRERLRRRRAAEEGNEVIEQATASIRGLGFTI